MEAEVLAGESCPLCGDRGEFVGHVDDVPLRICRCDQRAGVLLSWAWDSESTYEDWYRHPSAYHEAEQRLNGQRPYLERQQEHIRASCARVNLLRALYPLAPGVRLLDVGCGDGMFVKVACDGGCDAHGIEPNANVIAGSPHEVRHRLQAGGWQDIQGDYAFICLHDVFEHLTRPRSCLHRLQEHLGRDGRLVLEMPEFDSPDQRATGLGWKHIRPRQHVCLYSFRAAVQLFDSCGLELDGFCRPLGGAIGKATWFLRKRRPNARPTDSSFTAGAPEAVTGQGA